VLDELVTLGALTTDEALAAARRILGGTAAKLYDVPWP
jgi:hypothetical protein